MSPLVGHVAILHWPEEAAVVAYLRALGRPRLLLVGPDEPPPPNGGWEEDWIRMPARDDDVRARAEALRSRTVGLGERPELRSDGRVFFDGRWVSLSPTEHAIAGVLSSMFGEVVAADALARCGSGGPLSPTAVRVHVTRLRKRIEPIGLLVRTVRGRGYVLDRAWHFRTPPEMERPKPRLPIPPEPDVVAAGSWFVDGPGDGGGASVTDDST